MTELELQTYEEERQNQKEYDEYIENKIDEMREQRLFDEDHIRKHKDISDLVTHVIDESLKPLTLNELVNKVTGDKDV